MTKTGNYTQNPRSQGSMSEAIFPQLTKEPAVTIDDDDEIR